MPIDIYGGNNRFMHGTRELLAFAYYTYIVIYVHALTRDHEPRRICRAASPKAEGRKLAEARGEGRTTGVTTEFLNEASRRPSGQRADANFRAAERRSASRRGSWSRVAPNMPA